MHSIKFQVAGVEHTLDVIVIEKTSPFDDPSAPEATDQPWGPDRIAKLAIDPLAREYHGDLMTEAVQRLAFAGYLVVWATHLRPDLRLVVMPGEIKTFFVSDPECLAGQRKGGLYWRRLAADAWSGPAVHGRSEAIQALQRGATPRGTQG